MSSRRRIPLGNPQILTLIRELGSQNQSWTRALFLKQPVVVPLELLRRTGDGMQGLQHLRIMVQPDPGLDVSACVFLGFRGGSPGAGVRVGHPGEP